MIALHILISLLPVVCFLSGLVLVDSYKLVRFRSVGIAIGAGLAAAGAAWFVNNGLGDLLDINPVTYSRYVAPLTEEALKASWIIFVVFSDRVGFSVDAAIVGFSVGAGFAVLENLYFLSALDAGTQTWVVRGFGTAIMHGVTATVMAVMLRTLAHSTARSRITGILVAFALAVVLHSIYNHFPGGRPMLTTAFLIVTSPILVLILFQQSERQTRAWLGTGFDTDQELMTLLMSGDFSASRTGQYLTTLRDHFEGPIVADMLCLIRIRVELSIRAKGMLMMQEAGFTPPPDESVKAKFVELDYLEESIGKAGMLAIDPIQQWSSKELWQLNMLSER